MFGTTNMDIRKRIWMFVLVLLLLCVHHLPTHDWLVTASTIRKETKETYSDVRRRRWIQEQTDGTIDVCSDILGPKWKNETNQKPKRCQRLTVWVPKNSGSTKFVDVSKDGEVRGGFSIAVFCLVLQEVPFKIQPVFVPFDGSYDDLVKQVEGKDCEAIAGDVTISAYRTKYADFTLPYMSSEIYILVPATQKWNEPLVTLLKPFTTRLWLAVLIASIFIGIAIGFLEYRAGNPEFIVPFYQKFVMIIWFPISRFFFQEGKILNRCSKVVLVIWLTMIFIVIQIFTACLSSWLTVNQLQPKYPKHYDVVGYQNGSFVGDFASDHVQCPISIDNLQPLSMDDYKIALDTGKVNAIFDEGPFVDMFLDKYGGRYMKVGPLAEELGWSFAFSRGYPLQQEVSRAVVKVTESKDMDEMKKEYKLSSPFQTTSTEASPQSLDVHSFFLLFIFMGLATIMAIICSEISLMHSHAQISPVISMHPSLVQTIPANITQNAENEH